MSPGLNKFSNSRSYFSWLFPSKVRVKLPRTEKKEICFSGEYEKVLPMDIYPTHLLKSIMVGDIEMMENLGIYEVSPEDFAFVNLYVPRRLRFKKLLEKV